MRFTKFWQPLRCSHLRPRRLLRPALCLEHLEDRIVPNVSWSSAGSRTVVDQGGPVITHADVDLVFWGAGWNNAPTLKDNVINAVTTILNSPYLSGLSQYRGIGNGQLLRTDVVVTTSPAARTTHAQCQAFVKASLNNGSLPITPNMDSEILYMVIPQPGTTDPAEGLGGAHSSDTSNFGRFRFGWTINTNSLDDITYFFSHELTEAVTDPEVNFRTAFVVPSTNDEICDGEAQRYSCRLNGVLVQASLSQRDHAYEVYDGNTQKFSLSSSRALTLTGDQLPNADDTITIDQQNNGYKVTLNGEAAQFDSRDFFTGVAAVSSITLRTGNGDDTVNIERTVSGEPVTVILGGGSDTVNLGLTAQKLNTLGGAITVNGGSGSGTLEFFDQGVTTNQTYTVSSTRVMRSGLPPVTYSKLANVMINTSTGNDTIAVQGTPAGTTVAISGSGDTNTLTNQAADGVWTITGSNSGSLSGGTVAGLVTFSGVQNLTGAAHNTFVFSDGAAVSGKLQSGSGSSLDYSACTTDVSVNLQTGTATGVGGTVAGVQSLTGGGGNNTLVGTDADSVWNLTGMNTGSVTGSTTVAFTAFQNLIGGMAKNTFVFSDGAGISGNLDGGSTGALDYSAYASSVIVDLVTARATGIGGTLSHIQNVSGGIGGGPGVYNILVGNGGNALSGGTGRRNLLIAGSSSGTLLGGDDDDILIGGTTAYDMDIASLLAIMDYWSAAAEDYATRVANLTTGNGVPLLDATTVTGNGGGNMLTGGPGLNLYYGKDTDTTDFDPSSTAVFIPV